MQRSTVDDGAVLLAFVQRALTAAVAAAIAPLEAKIERLEAKIAAGPDVDHLIDAHEVAPLVGAPTAKALRARIDRGIDPIAVELGKLVRISGGRQQWRRADVLAIVRGGR
jgi:hypothetical protein